MNRNQREWITIRGSELPSEGVNYHKREWIEISGSELQSEGVNYNQREWVIVLTSQVSNLSTIWQQEVTVQWDAIDVIFVLDRHAYWIFIVLVHWTNSSHVDMSIYSDTLSSFPANQLLLLKQQIPMLYSLIWLKPMISHTQGGQEVWLTRGSKPKIYHTQGEHTNHYTTNDLPHSRWTRGLKISTNQNVCLCTYSCMLKGEVENDIFLFYGLTHKGLKTQDLSHSRWAH